MLASARRLEPLPQGHPCQGCEVRDKAVCGVLDCARLDEVENSCLAAFALRLTSGTPEAAGPADVALAQLRYVFLRDAEVEATVAAH